MSADVLPVCTVCLAEDRISAAVMFLLTGDIEMKMKTLLVRPAPTSYPALKC